jgi:glycosyltransferase involved in cell wall biosynthesis
VRIVIPVMRFSGDGGMRVLSQFANHWIRAGHEVKFLANRRSDPPYHPTIATIVWIDDAGREVGAPSATPEFVHHTLAIMRSLWRGLERYARETDIVLANHSFTAWPVFLSRVSARKLYYVQAYEPEYFADTAGFRGLLVRALSASTYLLPMSRIVNAPLYLRYGLLRSQECVPCGIDLSVMKPMTSLRVPKWGERRIVIGTIGRQEPHKGTREALVAVKLLLERGRNVELRVAYGNVPDGASLDGRLQVVVPRNDAELAGYYRSLDVIVAPVRLQLGAMHYPVLEGMACGKPVVTTGHLPASRERDNAWFVPVNDPAAIANAVEDIFSDPVAAELRVCRGLEDVAPFAWERVASEMLLAMKNSVGPRIV